MTAIDRSPLYSTFGGVFAHQDAINCMRCGHTSQVGRIPKLIKHKDMIQTEWNLPERAECERCQERIL